MLVSPPLSQEKQSRLWKWRSCVITGEFNGEIKLLRLSAARCFSLFASTSELISFLFHRLSLMAKKLRLWRWRSCGRTSEIKGKIELIRLSASPLLGASLWFSSPLRYSPPLCFSSLLSISLHLSASLPFSASLIRLSGLNLWTVCFFDLS